METPLEKEYFLACIDRWEQSSPEVVQELLKIQVHRTKLCLAENGQKNLLKTGDNSFYFHSSQNPSKEAAEWFSRLPLQGIEVLFVYGIGLGYLYEAAAQWLNQNPIHTLVFFEDDLEVLHHLFHTELGRDLMHHPRVMLHYIGPRDGVTYGNFEKFIAPFSLCRYTLTELPIYQIQRPQKIGELQGKLGFVINMHRWSLSEYGNYGSTYFQNYFHNVLRIPRSSLLNNFKGKFRGIPAIICGAGPSLQKNIDQLSALKDRAILFSGGTGLNALATQGIHPHFCVGIDPNPSQFTRFITLDTYEVPLIYRARLHYEAQEIMHGPKIYDPGSGGYAISPWLEERFQIPPSCVPEEGCNVLNYSLAVAYMMGCFPIFCVGIDLAYSLGQSYIPGIYTHPIHDRKKVLRSKTDQEELLLKQDIYGQPIYTVWKWITESLWYSKFCKDHPDLLLINATEGGLGFPDVKNMTLAEASKQYLTKTYDLEGLIYKELQSSSMPPQVNTKALEEAFGFLRESLIQCAQIADRAFLAFDFAASQHSPVDEGEDKFDDKLREEPSYTALLQPFHEAYKRSKDYDRLLLKNKQSFISEQDVLAEKQRIEASCYFFLKHTCDVLLSTLDRVLFEWKDMQEKVSQLPKATPVDHLQEITSREMKEGTKKTYYPEGKISSIQHFSQGLPEGKHLYFYSDGTLRSVLPYEKGRLHGEVLLYYPHGHLSRQLFFEHGKRNGPEKIWRENGQLKIEAEYKQDQPIGIAREWHGNGLLAREVRFDANSNVEEVQEWSENGEIIAQGSLDYFDDVSQETAKLTESLEEVYHQFIKVVPILEDQAPKKGSLDEDLKSLQEEMEKLRTLNEKLHKASGLAQGAEESLWKTENIQREMGKKLELLHKEMVQNIESIQKGMKNVKLPDKKNPY